MLKINENITIPQSDIEITAIRAQGAGGQHVNKNATAVHLRFNIAKSSLPGRYKDRLLALADHRINHQGEIIIKAQRHRSQEANRQEALRRLAEIIRRVLADPKTRHATKPSLASVKRRLQTKSHRAEIKRSRRALKFNED